MTADATQIGWPEATVFIALILFFGFAVWCIACPDKIKVKK